MPSAVSKESGEGEGGGGGGSGPTRTCVRSEKEEDNEKMLEMAQKRSGMKSRPDRQTDEQDHHSEYHSNAT